MRRALIFTTFALTMLACSSDPDTSPSSQGGSAGGGTGGAATSTGGAGGQGNGSAGGGGAGGSTIWSAAIEVCNGTDDDGDGLTDEDCPPSFWAGAFPPGGGADLTSAMTTQRIETDTGRPLPVIQTYHSTKPAGVAKIAADLEAIWGHGATPHLNMEPSGYTAAQYAAAASDAGIETDLEAMGAAIAKTLAGQPEGRLLLTFGAEMNGNWTNWGCLPAATYIAFYRKAHDVVSAALAAGSSPVDARRVRWVFGPNSTSSAGCGSAAAYYPGDAYSDYLGMSAYRNGTQSASSAVVQPAHELLSALGFSGASARDRFIVLQTGSRDEPGDDRGAWLKGLYGTLAADPVFLGAIYFNAADWAVLKDSSPPSPLAGYTGWTAALAALPQADGRLDGTFEPFFADVLIEHPYYAELQSLRAAGLTSGCSSAPPRFCGDEPLTRGAAAIFAARAFGIAADAAGAAVFEDVGAGDAGYGEIQALAKLGVLTGCSATAFCPDQAIERGALALVLAALSKPPAGAPGAFNDVDAADPAAAAIDALVALKRVDGCGADVFCPGDPASRGAGAAWIVRSAGVAAAPPL